MEDHRIESDQLPAADKESVSRILELIVADGRIRADGDGFVKANILQFSFLSWPLGPRRKVEGSEIVRRCMVDETPMDALGTFAEQACRRAFR